MKPTHLLADFSNEDQQVILAHALEKIRTGQMRELDPTLGDQGCHLRATPLIFIAEKVLQNQELAEEEKQLLISLETNWCNTLDFNAQNGFFLFNKSYNKLLPTYLKSTLSKTKSMGTISRHRVQASELSMTFLTQKIATLPENELIKELKASFVNDVKTVTRDREALKITPLYTSMRLVLEIMLKEDFPVLVVLQQYQHLENGKVIKLDKAIPLMYRSNTERTEFQPVQEPDHNKPALCVQIFTLYDQEKNKASLAELLARIRSTGLIEVLVSSSSGHEQYPRVTEEDKLASYEKPETEGLLRAAFVKSTQLFDTMKYTSERLNKKVDESLVELTDKEVFQIVHVYCSTYGTELKECEILCKDEMLSTRVLITVDQRTATYENLKLN